MNNGFKFNDVGTCPLCGSTLLDYDTSHTNGVLSKPWQCRDCNASGSEVYDLQFVTHSDVIDKDGNEVEAEPQDLDVFKDTSSNAQVIKSYSCSFEFGTDDDGETCKVMTIYVHHLDGSENSIADITMGLDCEDDPEYVDEICRETLENYGYEFEEGHNDEEND